MRRKVLRDRTRVITRRRAQAAGAGAGPTGCQPRLLRGRRAARRISVDRPARAPWLTARGRLPVEELVKRCQLVRRAELLLSQGDVVQHAGQVPLDQELHQSRGNGNDDSDQLAVVGDRDGLPGLVGLLDQPGR